MTVAFDAFTSGGASFTHTPVGTPRGVLVLISIDAQNTDTVTGVTYGGTAMVEVALSPLVLNAVEDGAIYGYFLGASVPTGAQTVATTASAGTPVVGCYTLTAAADTEIVDTTTINTNGTGDITGTLSLASRTSFCAEVWWSGDANPVNTSPLASWNSRRETDHGAATSGSYSYDTIGSTDVTFGLNEANATPQDYIILGAAVSEVAGAGAFTLDADAGSYTLTGTAATLEFDRLVDAGAGSYLLNGTDATLQFGNILDANPGSYALSGTAADLLFDRELTADAGTYVLSGSDAALDYVRIAISTGSQGGIGPKEYERRVRAYWDRLEELQRQRDAAEQSETERAARLKDRQLQLAALERKKRAKESQRSAAVVRRQKLAAEIAELEVAQRVVAEQIAALTALIFLAQTELAEVERARLLLADRRRRMVLLLAVAA